jgi:peptidoglycan hydrolase-like protein with peptidoglycan-binding domain
LYAADDEPVVALIADAPLLRELGTGVDDGPDVLALETNLVALGYRDGLTIDEHFDAATAAAVEAWEDALGRSEPDGVVAVGEVVYLAQTASVLTHEVEVGDALDPGTVVMVLGAESQVVQVDVDASEVDQWKVGTAVEFGADDDMPSGGTVTEVGRDVTDGDVAVEIALTQPTTDKAIGSDIEIVRTTAERTGVVAVPVAAVIEGDDGPAVRVAGTGDDVLTSVELGVVADGWVEVSGIDADTEVRLPG